MREQIKEVRAAKLDRLKSKLYVVCIILVVVAGVYGGWAIFHSISEMSAAFQRISDATNESS